MSRANHITYYKSLLVIFDRPSHLDTLLLADEISKIWKKLMAFYTAHSASAVLESKMLVEDKVGQLHKSVAPDHYGLLLKIGDIITGVRADTE